MTTSFTNLDGIDPVFESRKIAGRCPHCDLQATFTCMSHVRLDGSGSNLNGMRTCRYALTVRCDWCMKDGAFIRLVEIGSATRANRSVERFTTIDIEQVWPARRPRELAAEAPQSVRDVFTEAALAEATGAFRLAGIGYRATVEQIVKDRGAVGKNLYEKITGLTVLGVPQEIVDAFHEARFVGNDAAHDALAYSAEEISDVAELINEAVLVLYVQPAQRALMATQRAERRAAARNGAAAQSTP